MPLFKRRTGIAVVEMHGVIGAAIKEPDYSRIFERIASNRKIGALVLDIDSPGGSATASDLIYESVRRVAQRKPVVAYIRGRARPADTTSPAEPAPSWPPAPPWWDPSA